MKHLTLAAALSVALAASTVSAAPPASTPPPITGGVRVPSRFSYPYTRAPDPLLMRPGYTIYPSGVPGPAFGYSGNRYPLGGAPSQPHILWYW